MDRDNCARENMSQHLNFMLEHLKMGHRRGNNHAPNEEVVQCPKENGGPANLNSEKSPISALIQKFSGPSSASIGQARACPVPVADNQAGAGGGGSNNKNAEKVQVNSFKMSTLSQRCKEGKSKGDEADCSSAVGSSGSEQVVVLRKVNNSGNKLSVHSGHHEDFLSPPATVSHLQRKGSDSGQLRTLLASGEDRNGMVSSSSRATSNGHAIASGRKLSADFRLNHRDLLNEENGKHLSNKPARVKNLANRTEAYDMLHNKTVEKVRPCRRSLAKDHLVLRFGRC